MAHEQFFIELEAEVNLSTRRRRNACAFAKIEKYFLGGKFGYLGRARSALTRAASLSSVSIRIRLDSRFKHAGMTDFGLVIFFEQQATGNEL